MNKIHPALVYVQEARAEGLNGRYDECLYAYSNAKREAEKEISACRNMQDKNKWTGVVKDIVQEETAIRKIKNTVNEIVTAMNIDDMQRIGTSQLPKEMPTNESLNSREMIVLPVQRRNRPDGKRPAMTKAQRYSLPVEKKIIPIETKSQKKTLMQVPRRKESPQEVPFTLINEQLFQKMVDVGTIIMEPNVRWESIVGLDQVKRLLRQNLVILPMRQENFKGIFSTWRSVLFYGPSGTGKAFIAKAIATECKRTFFHITSETMSPHFMGESEMMISNIFAIADEMKPSTVFFDEIDSIIGSKGSIGENEASRKIKAQMLNKLEGIDGLQDSSYTLVMAATNSPWDLDEAILRRFQKRIYIPLPDSEGRKALLSMHIGYMIDDSFEMDRFAEALQGYSCADIEKLCKDIDQYVISKQTNEKKSQPWVNMPEDYASVIISNADFEYCLGKHKSSVDPNTISKYENWSRLKGTE